MLKYTFYGHACFLLDDGEYKILVDPFLSGNPQATISPKEVEANYILISHAHDDHLGDAPEIATRLDAEVVAIPEVLTLCTSRVEKAIKADPMNLGGTLNLPFGMVRMVPALHSSGVEGGIACGFVIKIFGKTIYYAGDTALFSDMKLIGERDKIDYAILPIGDNYTMGIEDAARAVSLLGANNVIPLHYGTWGVINQNPEDFRKLVTGAEVYVVKPGQTIELA